MEFRRLYLPDIIEWDEDQTTDTFGRLEVTPLERGFGRTLGTALRRALLSSIEGSAPVAIKIEGVKHEFTALDGVVEDVPEIILNVKSLGIRHEGEEPGTLRADVEGPAEVKAGDLEGDDFLSIANSDDPVAQVTEGGSLRMEIEVQRGKGYVTADEWRERREEEIGTILLDSWFGPVQKVNFEVDSARVGDKTDYDKLTMEVRTDGSITPRDAMRKACEILIRHLELIVTGRSPEEEVEEAEEAEGEEMKEAEEGEVEVEDIPLKETKLSPRLVNCLAASDVTTLPQLVSMTESDLLSVRNFGQASLKKVRDMLDSRGLTLAGE
ncbi:MAG: DNA-directed RNA polymerase subunit alpha [Candidatus Fermentibacterota bacterium]